MVKQPLQRRNPQRNFHSESTGELPGQNTKVMVMELCPGGDLLLGTTWIVQTSRVEGMVVVIRQIAAVYQSGRVILRDVASAEKLSC